MGRQHLGTRAPPNGDADFDSETGNEGASPMTTATSLTTTDRTHEDLGQALDALRARVAGDLLMAAADGYDEARRAHDITVDRRPLAIVRAANADDVAEAIRFARRHALPLAVRSGGHSIAAHSMIDDAIVVDLSGMRGISIDPAQRVARVQAGVTSGQLAGPAHAYGLALTTGDTSSVAVGGLITGGGMGWMVRKYGLAIDNLLSAQVVTASGEIVTASAGEHVDLFWAIRGGGGNFGIVTEFEIRLAPVGQVLGGALLLPATRDVIRGCLEYIAQAPEELSVIADVMHAPPAPFVPPASVGTPVLMVLACWSGDPGEGQRALAPLRALATPIADAIDLIPFPVMFAFTEAAAAPAAPSIRSMLSDGFSDAEIDAMIDALGRATAPMSMIQLRALGGAMARVASDETAFAHRERRYCANILAVWFNPDEDAAPHRAWVESTWEALRPAARGVYANFLADEGDARIREAYPAGTLERLARVKAMYDPENIFRFNQNIQPRP